MGRKRQTLRVRAPKSAAGGITAVANALRHATGKAGLADGTRILHALNQIGGIDCPGCAWVDPLGRRSAFEFCENGAKAIADEATRERVDAEFFARHSIEELRTRSGRWLNAQGRLMEPMWRAPEATHYSPIAWDQALDLIGDTLRRLPDPDQAAFYTSGRTSNEAAFLYQLLVRRYGTNNLPDCSNLCHESSGHALGEVLGAGKGSVLQEDFEKADLILIFGQNPGSNHPRMLATLQDAKRAGARIVTINPLDETGLKRYKNPQEVGGIVTRGTPLADLKLRVRVNGDVPLIKGLAKRLIERPGCLDPAFIEEYTGGFERYRADLQSTSWDDIVAFSGVPREDIEAAAELLANSRATIACWAMGITQHANAVDNIREIVNLLLLQGNLGKPGAGVCPVRGHSNVQGDRTMGIWERPSDAFLDSLGREFAFEPPREPGVNTVECIQGMRAGRIKVLFAIGGNFFRASPDTAYTAEALANCDLTVQVSTKLNKSHLYTGRCALILPTLGRTEADRQNGVAQFVTTENSMGIVQPSRGKLDPRPDDALSEVRIVAELGRRLFGEDDQVPWSELADDYDRIRDHIAAVVPGLEDFNRRLASEGHVILPHAVRDERRFNTATGRA
ncbi:MAG: FdhF/YdeP family oxidoreductase, partial [Xanthomonadales bacterium]|nr:FdhF/YdeP family oxidoreductase [Xanthomonadales bacterium]